MRVTTSTPPNEANPGAGDHARALLAAGVPLTLLLDLMEPGGPDSPAILAAEGPGRDLGAGAGWGGST